jgi:hypothetical protein
MSSSAKASKEVRLFLEFLERSRLPVDPSTVESREPPEPDVRCVIQQDGPVAFELVEICNSELAKDIGDQLRRGTKPRFHMLDDLSRAAFLGKLRKNYHTDEPIELLCYTGRTAVPDDRSLLTLRDLADCHGLGPFRRVWFLGEKTCEVAA